MSDTQQVAMLKQLLADSRAENEALRQAAQRAHDEPYEVSAWHGDLGRALARWREVTGEPDPIIPGYGSSI